MTMKKVYTQVSLDITNLKEAMEISLILLDVFSCMFSVLHLNVES